MRGKEGSAVRMGCAARDRKRTPAAWARASVIECAVTHRCIVDQLDGKRKPQVSRLFQGLQCSCTGARPL